MPERGKERGGGGGEKENNMKTKTKEKYKDKGGGEERRAGVHEKDEEGEKHETGNEISPSV